MVLSRFFPAGFAGGTEQAHKLADMYREQCVNMETDLSQIREEGDVGREIFKVCKTKLLHQKKNN